MWQSSWSQKTNKMYLPEQKLLSETIKKGTREQQNWSKYTSLGQLRDGELHFFRIKELMKYLHKHGKVLYLWPTHQNMTLICRLRAVRKTELMRSNLIKPTRIQIRLTSYPKLGTSYPMHQTVYNLWSSQIMWVNCSVIRAQCKKIRGRVQPKMMKVAR